MSNDKVRDAYYRKKYCITVDVFNAMMKEGHGACWICEWKPGPEHKRLNVDHCHKTGRVRGLLCMFCNKKVIGRHRREHAFKFTNAATYLLNVKDWRVPCLIKTAKPRGTRTSKTTSK